MSSSVGLGITNPIKAGSIRAAYDLSSSSDTDWHNLTSDMFKDSASGLSCAEGLRFAWVGVVNLSTDGVAHVKYRAFDTASDVTTNEIPVLPYSAHTDDLATLQAVITTVAVKKYASSDSVYIIAGFDRG